MARTRASATRTCSPRCCRRWWPSTASPGERLGDVTGGAVLKHSKDFNLVRECVLSSGLDPATPGIDMQRACGTGLDADDLDRDEDRARARWTRASPAASTPSAIRPSSIRAPTSSCCCARIAARPPGSASSRSSDCGRRHFKPVMPGVLEPRTGLSMGEHCEQMAKTWKISRADQDALANSQPRERRQGLGARLLQRPGAGRVPGPHDGQQRARRQHGREVSHAASRRSTAAAARARSPPAIPRRSPTAPPRCCSPARNGRASATCRSSRGSATASSGRSTTSAARKGC